MSFLYGFIMLAILVLWAYVYMKTYQLEGYKIGKFFDKALSFNLANGKKNKLILTKRMWRYIITYIIFTYALMVINCQFTPHWALIIFNFLVYFLLTPVFMVIVHYIILPIEILIKKYYMGKAARKLATKSCKRIGITGSFGKTSTKNILASILEKEFKVCVTPASYNTEMGICKTILEKLDDEDVFIAEMGARNKGDIRILTEFVRPQYAILTTVGPMHLESFKTIENIEQTKFELLQFMDRDGSAVINGDGKSNLKLYKKCKVSKFLTCVEGSFAWAKDIKTGKNGSSFTLMIEGQEVRLTTRLLGKCNIDNIVTASALAYIMGITLKDIKDAVAKLEPTPHRLELIKNGNVNIIDDSYNSNLTGALEALNVLKNFEGRKIVITPGFVEMGEKQSDLNFRLGAEIADIADYVIVMNETNKNDILSGLISHNFKQGNIFFANDREKQKEYIARLSSEGCVILFENDLPDNFS